METISKKTISRDLTNNLAWLIFFAAIVVIFLPIYKWIWLRWTDYDSYFSHGPIILFISLFLFWKLGPKRPGELPKFYSKASLRDYLVLLLLSLAYLFFSLVKVYFLVALFGWALIALALYNSFDRTLFKSIAFPLFFLLLAIPFPMVVAEQLALFLKTLSAHIAGHLLSAIGITTKVVGNRLYTPYSVLEVGAPCSGLRSIISLFSVSILFAYMNGFGLKKALALVVSAPLVAFLGNILRVFVLGFVSDVYGAEVALGRFHDALGYIVFILDLFVLFLISRLLRGTKNR